jgi:hypothetical protein
VRVVAGRTTAVTSPPVVSSPMSNGRVKPRPVCGCLTCGARVSVRGISPQEVCWAAVGLLAGPDPALCRGPVAQLGLENCFFIYFTNLMLDSKIHIS